MNTLMRKPERFRIQQRDMLLEQPSLFERAHAVEARRLPRGSPRAPSSELVMRAFCCNWLRMPMSIRSRRV